MLSVSKLTFDVVEAEADRRGIRTPTPAKHRCTSVGRTSVVRGYRNRNLLLLADTATHDAQIHAQFRERVDFLLLYYSRHAEPEIVRSMMDRTETRDDRTAFELRNRHREQNGDPFDPDRRENRDRSDTVRNAPFDSASRSVQREKTQQSSGSPAHQPGMLLAESYPSRKLFLTSGKI